MKTRNVGSIGISIVVVAMFAGQLRGGMNRWTSRGPDGGSIATMVADHANPAILYLGTLGGGVYKTEDAGQSWRPVNQGISDPFISTLVARRDQPATLFGGTRRGTILRTRDGGEHWSEVARLSGYVRALVFDQVEGDLYALSGTNDLMRSIDEGETWKEVSVALPLDRLVALNGKLYAISRRTVYVSANGGADWTSLLSLTPLLSPGTFKVALIAVDEDRSSLVIASDAEVAQSFDGGKDWELYSSLRPMAGTSPVRVSALAPYGNGVVVATNAGVFRYTDYPYWWTSVGNTLNGQPVSLVVRTAANSEHIFAVRSDTSSLYRWAADQEDWEAMNTGLRSASTMDVAAAGSEVYAATSNGLARLNESSDRWDTINVSSSATTRVNMVEATTSGVLLAGTSYGLHKSEDGGSTWKLVASVVPPISDYSYPSVSAVGVASSDPKTMYAALADGMSKSTNGGDTWFPIQSNIPMGYDFFYYGFGASTVEVDPVNPDTVYVCADLLYKSSDGGGHWIPIFQQPTSAFAIDRFNPSLLYAATYSRLPSLSRSNDAGATWERLDFQEGVNALAVDPARASVVYAGTADGNLYRSMNGGRSWRSLSDGLSGAAILKLAIDSAGNRLYAATSAGVFEFQRDTTYLAGAVTHSVSLRTYYGNFVSAADCGDSRVTANAASAGPCETFTLYDVDGGTLVDGDRVYLQASNGSFVSAEHGGASACGGCESPLDADRFIAEAWETFTIHKMGGGDSGIADGDSISLQSIAGDYIAAERGGSSGCGCDSVLNANRSTAREWETFAIILH